ncbi:hypothetical protein E4T49_06788 [Aureobasidium sp. EXF-10728]|nr:hypothetical protein E4T49_06788 [Aureobasidium sp. EXF-10728]
MEQPNPWEPQGIPIITHTPQVLSSTSSRAERSLSASDKKLKKQIQPRQLLSCTKCRERKVKCDRTKPCSACCARGLPKECHFVLGEGADFGPIQQSLELRRLRAENQRLKERLLAERSSLSEDSETEEGAPNARTSSIGRQMNRQRRLRASEQIDSIYFGSPGLASVIADVEPKSLSHAMPRAADMYATQDAMYPFPTLWPAMSRTHGLLQCLPSRDQLYHYLDVFSQKARGFAFPYVPEDLSQKEVERFLEKAEENAEKVPDLLALIFAALALGVQLDTFGSRKDAESGVTQTSSRKGEIFSVAAMQALRLASFTSRPTLRGIKALIMLAPYLTNSGRFLDAWSLSGLTIRLAHSIGLHRNPRYLDPAPSLRESTVRRNLWWWLLHMDQEYSMTLGRPLGISGIGDCPPPDPLTTDPVALRLNEFFDQLTIHGRQILSSNQLTDSKIDMYTDRLIALWDTMPDSLQFNRSWIEEETAIPEWPMETRAAISYCSIHNYIILLNRQRIENNRNSPNGRPRSPRFPHLGGVPEFPLQPTSHSPSPAPMVPRGRPLVIESCLALLDAFQFFYKRVPSALVDWTIGQQAFNACMILLLGGIDCESIEHIGRVEKAYTIFVEMDKAEMHQLTGLAMSRITDGLKLLRQQSETRKRSMNEHAISPMSLPQSHEGVAENPFDLSMGQRLRSRDFLHESVMGATGMFLLEDPGLQTSAARRQDPSSAGGLLAPEVAVVPSSEPSSFKSNLISHPTLLDPRRDSAHPMVYTPGYHLSPMPVAPAHFQQLAPQHLIEMQPMPAWGHTEGWQANVQQYHQPHHTLYTQHLARGGGNHQPLQQQDQQRQ